MKESNLSHAPPGLAPAARKVLSMCLIHDLGELYTGDIPDFNYAFNLTYGASYFEGDPRLKELRDILDAETKARITHTQEKENHTP